MISRFKTYIFILGLLLIGLCGGLFLLPKPALLTGLSFSTAVYDSQSRLLRLTLSTDEQYRLFVPLPQIAPVLIEATLLQEDRYFWQHYGVNPVALLKAIWTTYVSQSRRLGASTITMQLARLRFNLHSRSVLGKGLQLFRAIQLERHYSKRELLEAYLTLAPYGNNIQGIGAASLIYFNKQPHQLTLPEALTLSIIPQNPNQRTPRHPQLHEIRKHLFARWVKEHPSDQRLQPIIDLPLVTHDLSTLPFLAPQFVNGVVHTSASTSQQHNIVTTLDLNLQSIISNITRHYIHRKTTVGAYNAAVLLVDARDMSIKSAIGSVDFFNQHIQGQIDGTNIKRSPGSTLKPFIYGLALDQGLIHPSTMLKDVPHRFGQYNPENFDYDFMGPVKAQDALILSRNIPAIDLASQLTQPSLYQLLEQAEISQLKPESHYGLALSLGGAELTMHELVSLYAMLANKGLWRPLRETKDAPLEPGKRLLSPEASFLINDMLSHTPRPDGLTDHSPVYWKTGTSSGYRDAWSIGSFGPYVLAVWVGHFNNQGNPAFIGKSMAAPLFFELVQAIEQARGPLPTIIQHTADLNLAPVAVCKASGLLPTPFCKDTEMTWFIPGKSPITTDTIYREVAINTKTGLRTCHIDQETRFEIFEFWPTDLLAIFKQAGIQRRTPPPFEPGCLRIGQIGISPQITSPQTELHYVVKPPLIRSHALAGIIKKETRYLATSIPLTAVTDADVAYLYWFINDTYLAKVRPDSPFLWTAKPGRFTIRVVDDHGRSDARSLIVELSG